MFTSIRLTCLAACMATPLAAADLALVIGNEDYDDLPDNTRGDEVVDAARELRDAGVEVIAAEDASLERSIEALSRFVQSAPRADRLLVVLAGRFASTATDAYLLPVESAGPPLAELPSGSLPVSVLLAVLGEAPGPGRSVLVLSTEDAEGEYGRYAEAGYGDVDVPQGVTLVEADPDAAEELISEVLATPGRPLAEGVAEIDGARVRGFLPDDFVFLDRRVPADGRAGRRARQAWETAREADTVDAYQRYLERYPEGRNATEARLRITELRSDPTRRAELDERALDLTRDERRQVQRDLAILGHNTRGIDGIFGEGTRSAIRNWQEASGYEVTGFLTASQVVRLTRDAVARSAELEREAEERRARQAVEDRAYWRQTGARETEQGYRRYLERYPDGLYAEIARGELAGLEEEVRSRADAADRAAWMRADAAGSRGAYESYLNRFPTGAYASAARARIAEAEESAERRAAAETERALGLNPVTARLVEERLNAIGLEPGPVDGNLDDQTRRAIRRYQGERNLPVTGYLNQPTVVQLLADSVRQILQ